MTMCFVPEMTDDGVRSERAARRASNEEMIHRLSHAGIKAHEARLDLDHVTAGIWEARYDTILNVLVARERAARPVAA